MCSGRQATPLETAETKTRAVYRLLDVAFGFGVWAVHLVIVYTSSAVACQLGLGSRAPNAQSRVVAILIAITFMAAALVIVHGVKRYRRRGDVAVRGFLARLAVGDDALAVVAILWQLVPITMVPLCR
jgi:hypothetical protein